MKIGGKTVGDMKQLLKDRPNDQMIWLKGFDFRVCESDDGTLDLYDSKCPDYMKELM